MKVTNWQQVHAEAMGEAAPGVVRRVLVGPDDGAPNFILRHFTVDVGACSPHHEHAWEHEAFILTGKGVLVGPEGEQPFKPGDAVFVPPLIKHQFRNTGDEPLAFLCIVPLSSA